MTAADLGERLRPGRDDAVDVAFACLLSVLGVIGFRTTFAGHEELLVGVPAVLAGAALGFVLARLRVGLLPSAAIAVVAFFVLGGPLALRHRAALGVLPSPRAVTALADGVIDGWIRLLTTLPPAGRAGDLLAIPYLCGFAGGLLAVSLARRAPRQPWCAAPAALVLVVSVLMGTRIPASLLLQGAAFTAVTIAWLSVRHHRARTGPAQERTPSRSRLAAASGLLLAAALGGVAVGPRLPGGGTDRYALREHVDPPFDPLTEPSPLASYRNYTDQDVREDEILTVRGLPDGARLRIAAMDSFSGTEWEATGSGSVVAGEYLRVGAEIPAEGLGAAAEVRVVVHRPEGVWVPLAGDVTRLDFQGDRGDDLDDEVRVSIETDTAAVPQHLQAGDRYEFTAEFVDLPDEDVLVEAALDARFTRSADADVPAEFVSRAADWAADQPTAFAEVLAIARGLTTEGAYSDGGPDANPVSPPGHSLRRLLDFIDAEQPFGNGEQFAAAQGLLAQARGVPVRVVMGFVNTDGADEVTFRGEDIEAWIEVPVDGYGWVAVDGTPPEDQLPDPIRQPRSEVDNPEPQPPPPTTIPPPTSIPDDLQPETPDEDEDDGAGGGVPGWLVAVGLLVGVPAVCLAVPLGTIVLLKRRRRERRRTRGSAASRVTGSFDELVDLTRDTGRPVPPHATREELSLLIGGSTAAALAERADTADFGPGGATLDDVDAAWADFHAGRAALGQSRLERFRTAINPTSLQRRRR